ncbi:MAG: Rnase Y domain-containing protein, partial [Gemmatimonadota bacterium]
MFESFVLTLMEGVVAGVVVALLCYWIYTRTQRKAATGILAAARGEAKQLVSEAAKGASEARTAIVLEGKMEALRLREEFDRDVQRRREEFDRFERRAEERDRQLEHKVEQVQSQERGFTSREATLTKRDADLKQKEAETERLIVEQRQRLERIAGLTADEARREVLQRVEDEARSQAAALVRDIKEQAKKSAER